MYFDCVKKALDSGQKVYWHYGLLGVAEITHITKGGKLSFIDITDQKHFLNPEEFDNYNKGCKIEDILKLEVDDDY